jgi:vancomycin resistance protein YoaR
MPEHPPVSDSTVRMDSGRRSGRPPATGQSRQVPAPPPAEMDDTRPVPRDWMRESGDGGAPAGAAEHGATTVLTAEPPPEGPDASAADEAAWEDDTAWDIAAPGAITGDSSEDTAVVDLSAAFPVADSPAGGPADDPDETAPQESLRSGAPGGPGDGGPGDGGPGAGGPDAGGPGPGGRGQAPWWRRRVVLTPVAVVAVLGGAYGVDLLVSSGDVPRHTVVDGVDIGGLSPAAASGILEKQLAPTLAADRTVLAAEVRSTFSPKQAGLGLDVRATVAAAARQPLNPWTRLTSLVADRTVRPVLGRDATDLSAELAAVAAKVDKAPVEATVALDGTTATVVQPADGRRLDRRRASAAISAALVGGRGGPIRLPVVVAHPHVTAAEAQKVLDGTVTPALSAPVTVLSQDGRVRADVPVSAIAAALTFTPKDNGELAVAIDPAKLQAALGRTFTAFGSPAKDATFRVSGSGISVVPSVDGSGVDPAKLASQLMSVLTSPAPRSVTAELGPVPAAFTTDQANALGIKEQIGSFTTHFAATPSATNIRVVAAKVNGAVVKPGETFSLNTFTGTRGTAQGYVPAGVIEGGKFTTAVGGGISQFATTMFNAEFFSGVQDIHHQPHSYWISRYPAGREATVFDGLIDLVWKNDADTGIYVQTAWTPSSITVTFWGTRRYDIGSVSGERRNVVQPAVQEMPDDGTCKAQAGMEGFDITVTRVFKDLRTGAVLRTQDLHTHYKAEPVIHCVPASAPAGTAPTPPPTGTGRRPAGTPGDMLRRPTRRRRR